MAIMKKLSLLASAAVVSAAMAMSGSARADTFSYQGTNVFNGGGKSNVTTKIVDYDAVAPGDQGDTTSTQAGGFRLTNGTDNFIAWCLDVLDTLGNNQTYTPTVTPFDDYPLGQERIDNIQKLFNTAYSGVDLTNSAAGNVQSAAFQVALWEIVYEAPDATSFDVNSGNFFLQSASTAVKNQANNYLLGLGGSNTSNYQLTFWESDSLLPKPKPDRQDLVTATVVPLPPAILMLLSGLLGLGFLSRRRSRMA
jgi:hypothetical protein